MLNKRKNCKRNISNRNESCTKVEPVQDVIVLDDANESVICVESNISCSSSELSGDTRENFEKVHLQDNGFFIDTKGNFLNKNSKEIKVSSESDVIVITEDESDIDSENNPVSNCGIGSLTNKTTNDDSVIFVSEKINVDRNELLGLNFIPLQKIREIKLKPQRKHKKRQRRMRKNLKKLISTPNKFTPETSNHNLSLLSDRDNKIYEKYNINTFNPVKIIKEPGKRMVLIDGSNVAFGYSLGKEFSVKGLEICINYFEKIGHEVKAVVPQLRLNKKRSTDPEKLENLYQQGKLIFTPCKKLCGTSATSYDDRIILQVAIEFDAVIVSNDNYQDLMYENTAFKKFIENRVLSYTWCKDMFILPQDPYGKKGPLLHNILNRT